MSLDSKSPELTNPDIVVKEFHQHVIPQDIRIAFIKDPVLATECLFGFQLAYFQITRLQEAWFKTSFMDCSGYGTGKTFIIALLMALRAILLPNRVQMIVSHTYGGVKLIFDTYLEPWFFEIPEYARHFPENTKHPISKTSELYTCKFANGNDIRGVPPGFLSGANRMRSERCNDLYLDEWAHYASQQEIDTVIKSRATRINPFHKIQPRNTEEASIKNALSNHKTFFSSPNYKFHDSYKRAKYFIYKAHVEKHPNYGYESYSYLDLVADGREDLTDLEAIEESKAMLPKDLFERDYLGKWVAGSKGYYNYDLIQKVRSNAAVPLLKGAEGDIFIKGVDVARSIKGRGDDFAVSVIKFNHRESFAHEFVHQVIKNNLDADEMAYEIHLTDERFPGPLLLMDPGGGGQFVEASLKKRSLELYGELKEIVPIYDIDSAEGGGKNILHWFSRGNRVIREVLGAMSGDDVLVNNAHTTLKNFLEKASVLVPYSEELSVYFTRMLDNDIRKRNFEMSKLNELEQVYYNIELTMRQLQGVQLKTDRATGKPVLTSRGQFVFTSPRKKDAAYSFLYAIFGVFLYQEMMREEKKETDDALGLILREDLEIGSERDDHEEYEGATEYEGIVV